MSDLLKKEKGFTLIEIVLVLAIAGLILVIVFLAVSGAQKSRRDTQRKDDNARMLSQMESCASNNSGDYTNCNTAAMNGTYKPTNFNDPSTGGPYGVTVVNGAPTLVCNAGNFGTIQVGVAGRQVTSRMCLEQGFQDLKNF